MGPIIIPMDGFSSNTELLPALGKILQDPVANELISYVKFNDAVHMKTSSGPTILDEVQHVLEKNKSAAGIFLDLKLADTKGTNVNILKHYADQFPTILTVSECCSADSFLKLRRQLPNTKIALVSFLTDTPTEECQRRKGMIPAIKILNDITNIRLAYKEIAGADDPEEPFDMVVCSPLEVEFLFNLFCNKFELIVPGIRDKWMLKGQQARTTGVRKALSLGTTFVVMGSQIFKGNPDKDISAEKSREMTMKEIKKSNYVTILPKDPLATLANCNGFYEGPVDTEGNFLGPLVPYAKKYDGVHNFVGNRYINVAKAETNSRTLRYFSFLIAEAIREKVGVPDIIIGAPMGGILSAGAIALKLGCRVGFAVKKVIKPADLANGIKEESELIIERHEINPGERVIIIEDLCNNFSTTGKLEALIKSKSGEMIAIACVFNRSKKTLWNDRPVISVIHEQIDQYKQNDLKVEALIEAKNIVWDPKNNWSTLKKAMMEKR